MGLRHESVDLALYQDSNMGTRVANVSGQAAIDLHGRRLRVLGVPQEGPLQT